MVCLKRKKTLDFECSGIFLFISLKAWCMDEQRGGGGRDKAGAKRRRIIRGKPSGGARPNDDERYICSAQIRVTCTFCCVHSTSECASQRCRPLAHPFTTPPSLVVFILFFSALSTLWESSPHNPLLIAQRHVTRAKSTEAKEQGPSYPGAWPLDR